MKTIAVVTILILVPAAVRAQSGITGSATITLEDGGTDCLGAASLVHVYADISGLTGTGGAPAGLNSFVLTIELSGSVNHDVFASAAPGTHPDFSWSFQHTDRARVETDGILTLVGWVAFPDEPSTQVYHLATIILSGTAQTVMVAVDRSKSSLGSRVVNPPDGDGPGPIDVGYPIPLMTGIPIAFPLDLNEGVASWREDHPAYDLASPSGPIDINDLVKLINCGG